MGNKDKQYIIQFITNEDKLIIEEFNDFQKKTLPADYNGKKFDDLFKEIAYDALDITEYVLSQNTNDDFEFVKDLYRMMNGEDMFIYYNSNIFNNVDELKEFIIKES